MSIVIATPTGNIGHVVVQRLLEAGETLTVLARNPDKLPDVVRSRATVHQGNLTDAAFVASATKGAKALFWLTPSDLTITDVRGYYETIAGSVAGAIRENRIPYIVNLSSTGAHLEKGTGPIAFLGIIEKAIDEVAENVLHLRPGYFFENFLTQIEPIRTANSIFNPVRPEATLPMIATRDIAEVAASRLLARDWSGRQVHGLHGPADLSFGEATALIGEAIERPLNYVPISPEQMRQTLLSFGASPAIADLYLEMEAAFDSGLTPAEPRTLEITTPTTIAQWAREMLRPAVEQG
jgi:uncharacterized protein YbjT (DUF2867 family)